MRRTAFFVVALKISYVYWCMHNDSKDISFDAGDIGIRASLRKPFRKLTVLRLLRHRHNPMKRSGFRSKQSIPSNHWTETEVENQARLPVYRNAKNFAVAPYLLFVHPLVCVIE